MKILIIEERSYGDAIIALNAIKSVYNADEYIIDILCTNENKNIFIEHGEINRVWSQNFWIGENKSWNVIKQSKMILQMRQQEYDYVLDFFGDIRERMIGYFCGGKKFITVERATGHPFNHLIRSGLSCLADEKIFISNDVVNIYKQIRYVFERVGLSFLDKDKKIRKQCNIVAIHPFASQKCREWSFENWRALVERLLEDGKKVVVFGAPNERQRIGNEFEDYICKIEIVTVPLQEFLKKLREMTLLIGLDSFSIHAAYAVRVRNIMINGSNDYRMWQTPLTTVVHARDGACLHWPCYNRPKCDGKYECIKSIAAEEVLRAVRELESWENGD